MPPRQGAFAEMVKIPEPNIIPIPDDLTPSHAALVEPVATALHGVCVAERALWQPLGDTWSPLGAIWPHVLCLRSLFAFIFLLAAIRV